MKDSSQKVISFWFNETTPKQWFNKDKKFDKLVTYNFLEIHNKAIKGELYYWRNTVTGRLAEIIVLDQFSRNIYRDDPRSFLFDPIALILAQECISLGIDKELANEQKWALYLPFMHSESKEIHKIALDLFTDLGIDDVLEFEIKHKYIIDKFGRYPHRNKLLGRKSTEEEEEFLKSPNSSF